MRALNGPATIHALATAALDAGMRLPEFASSLLSNERREYEPVYNGTSEWRILPVVDHADDPARLLVSGTGLTHRRSADQRQSMHAADTTPTDSLRMYQLGVDGGKPEQGRIGNAPEWFYKGSGTRLRGHNETLVVSSYAEDGGEEPEIAGVYLIDRQGVPRRLGLTTGNEFSDHVLEQRNYLYLAASKLSNSAIGPELVLDPGRPGDLHVHYFGADAFSFGAGIRLETGDVMRVQFEGFGRPLRNPILVDRSPARLVEVVAG